jgi:plasmid stabilization system protein ParE
MAELSYSVAAVADIEDITEFGIERFGPRIALDYVNGLELACEQLRMFPERSAVVPRIGREIRCLVYRRHRILYSFSDAKVLVVRILHHAQDVRRAMG